MKFKELVERYIVFIIGVFFIALGIALIIKSDLGNSPISSAPYVFSLYFNPSVGLFTFLLNMLFLLLQMIFLKKEFKMRELLQIPISLLFGFFIDFALWIVVFLDPVYYSSRLFVLIIGCLLLGFGVYLEMITNVVMLSAEALIRAITVKYKKDFGWTKISFDITLMLIACISSYIFFGEIIAVREGTVIAAVLVGYFARFFYKKFTFINQFFPHVIEEKQPDENNLLIAITHR